MAKRTCVVDGCENFVTGHGYCVKHYKRWRKYGDPLTLVRNFQGEECQVDGCDSKPHAAQLCPKHYGRMKRYGDPLDVGDAARKRARRALEPARLIDANGYARLRIDGAWVYEHRHLWEQANGPIPDGYHIHHVNHDRADNRLSNLELVPGREHNRRHTSARYAAGKIDNRGHNSAKYRIDIDDEDVVRRVEQGMSYRAVARLYGTSHSVIAHHYRLAKQAG